MVSLIPETISPYKLIYYGCRCAGVMKNDGKPWSLLVMIYEILCVNTMGLTSFLEICLNKGNLQRTIEAMSVFAIYIQVNCKIVNMLMREKDFRNLLFRLETFRFEILKDENNRKYISEAEIMGRKFITILSVLFISSPIVTFISTTLNEYEEKRLTIRIWIPWDMEEFSFYVAGNFVSSVISLSAIIVYLSFGVIQITFTVQMSAYLQVLKNYLETKGVKDRSVYQHHLLCIELINTYNDIFSGQIYLEILVGSIMPCGFAFSLLRALKTHSNSIDIILQIIICLASPCIICLFGQLVSTQTEQLHESSYMSHWYEEKPKIRSNLLTIMTMTTRPSVPNYRKFIRFDHVCMASVFQGLYSFFMMLINFDSD